MKRVIVLAYLNNFRFFRNRCACEVKRNTVVTSERRRENATILFLLLLCLSFVFFNFCSTEVTVAEDSDDEFAYEEVKCDHSTCIPGTRECIHVYMYTLTRWNWLLDI